MAYRVHEQNGNWMVSKDGDGVRIGGGTVIDYAMYQKLKNAPHAASQHFRRAANGDLVAKIIEPAA